MDSATAGFVQTLSDLVVSETRLSFLQMIQSFFLINLLMKSALETVWESLKLSVKWLQWKLADPRLNGLSGEERPEAEGEAVE